MEFQPDGAHLLRADKQYLFAVQREKVRAFPHLTILAAGGIHRTHQRPGKAILAAVEQHGAAAIGRAVAHHQAVTAVRFPPDFRVAEIHRAAAFGQVGGRQHRVAVPFFIVDAVAHRQRLGLGLGGAAILAQMFAHSGVHQQLAAVRQFHRAAGKAAVLVICRIGGQSCG